MELTCYLHPSWHPRIRPAGSKREWMDATPESFAYRCLPLAIANAHGWEVGSPCAFRARWNGGQGVDAVEIEVEGDVPENQRPVSLFGSGTITFHIEGLIRTSPGYNLWVGGPPNAAKHGIAPLTGVIETDWSPYTFTMNWRFTAPGEWVRFEEDEPFCFFYPVERGLIDRVEARMRPLSDAPELEEAFMAWSASRDAFQEHVARTQPEAPSDRWQKLYYRGVCPNGEPGAADHQAKLRPPAFQNAPEKGRCPMATQAKAVVAAVSDPHPIAAQRQAWRERTQKRQAALADGLTAIPILPTIPAETFLDLFYAPGVPVLIEGLAANWPAVGQWTPEYLAEKVGHAEITYQGGRNGAADFELAKDRHIRTMPFDAYIDAVTGGETGNDAYITAYNSTANKAALAPLMADLGQVPYLDEAEGMLWIGPQGTFTPLHHDLTNNLLVQVTGAKRLHLIPPSETHLIANTRHVFSDVHDILDEEKLAQYPAARQAVCYEIDILPGDGLFIPVGWWHQVRSLSFNTMLTYTNFLWPNDAYKDFPTDQ